MNEERFDMPEDVPTPIENGGAPAGQEKLGAGTADPEAPAAWVEKFTSPERQAALAEFAALPEYKNLNSAEIATFFEVLEEKVPEARAGETEPQPEDAKGMAAWMDKHPVLKKGTQALSALTALAGITGAAPEAKAWQNQDAMASTQNQVMNEINTLIAMGYPPYHPQVLALRQSYDQLSAMRSQQMQPPGGGYYGPPPGGAFYPHPHYNQQPASFGIRVIIGLGR